MNTTAQHRTPALVSSLWTAVMVNMIFADIFSIMIELVNHDTLHLPGDVTTVMAIAAVVTNIPIAMIFLSRMLRPRANRVFNTLAGILTILYIAGGGSAAPHYLIIGTIEIALIVWIIALVWRKSYRSA